MIISSETIVGKKYTLWHLRLVLWPLLLLFIAQPAFGAIFWKGKFKVISANPWKIEITESYYGTSTNVIEPGLFRRYKTGLPFVTKDHWVCQGRKVQESDVGQIYEFIGDIPDIGGVYDFCSLPQTIDNSPAEASSEYYTAEYRKKSLCFRSKWSQPNSYNIMLIGAVPILLAIICFGYWMLRPYRGKAR